MYEVSLEMLYKHLVVLENDSKNREREKGGGGREGEREGVKLTQK